MTIAVRLEGIVKHFPGIIANDHISLEIEKGEIHALLGENGAGKTTLMNILFGLVQPDSGRIFMDGQPVHFDSPADAIKNGIGMVHQHFMLTPVFSVCENIMLVDKSPKEPFLDKAGATKRIMEIAKSSGLHIDPDARVNQLCVGDQQRVEIIKALYRGAKVIIMDEPTSVLTPKESDELFVVLRKLADRGQTIIFITHKLREVMEISDRVTVLRDGKKIGTVLTKETNQNELAKMMVGREVLLKFEKTSIQAGQTMLEVRNVETAQSHGCQGLKGVSLAVHAGEILGIAGVDGNGQNELVEVIMGLRKVNKGDIRVKDVSIIRKSIRQILDLGVSNIPFLRQKEGLILPFSLSENLILKEWRNPPITKNNFFNHMMIQNISEKLIHDYDIRTTGPEAKVSNMSGGNQQKVVLARELSRRPDVLIACHPTHGLDIGATEYVRQELLNERARGAAVLLISTELDEILAISDRILVFFNGEIMGEIKADQANIEEIGMMMLGIRKDRRPDDDLGNRKMTSKENSIPMEKENA